LKVVANPKNNLLHEIHELKRELFILRRAAWPLREVVGDIAEAESRLVKDSTKVYFREVHNHLIQIVDIVETFRDMLSGMIDIYLSSISNRLNEVMKVLTMIATIFIPLTFIVGVYGMNFKYMPELEWEWGYPAILGLMLAVAVIMVIYFKKKNWL